ncbi:MAG: low temperature requirement protein A [Myxacorys chilensis ATA2-1-KO14]|nr:low temperature requirement protein A [Myxacorys chilensis ATA2-1-KO14]
MNICVELARFLLEHLTLVSSLQFAALFIPCWRTWILFIYYANGRGTDDIRHHLLILAEMLAVLILGVNLHDAFSDA